MLPDVINRQAHCLHVRYAKNVLISSREFCQQTILMKYHALFVIFEKAAKNEIGVCCKL